MKGWTFNVQQAVVVCLLMAGTGCAFRVPATAVVESGEPSSRGLSAEQSARAEALARYSRGLSMEWNREGAQAFSNFQEAARLDPDNEELQFRVALGLMQEQRSGEAVALMQRLVKRHPRSQRAHLWLAFLYRTLSRNEEALRTYERALRVPPARGPDGAQPAGAPHVVYLEMASLYTRMNRPEEAVKLLEGALDKVENPEELLQALGDMYIRQAALTVSAGGTPRLKSALRVFEQGVAQHPGNEELLFQLGDLYVLAGDFEKAVSCFERIEEANPQDLRIKQKLAMSLLAKGDRTKAIATLEQLLEREPDNARVLYYLAHIREQSGEAAQARTLYERAIRAAPQDAAAYLRLAMLEVAADQTETALRVLQDGLDQLPDDARFLELLAYIHLGRKDYAKALEYFSRTQAMLERSQRQPITPNFHLNFAIATQLAGETGEAASLLYKAMGVNRAYLDAYVQYVFQEPGQTNLASSVRVLDKLGEKSPEDPSLFLYIGLLNSYAKLYPAALAAFEKAEKLASDQEVEEDILTASFYFWYGAACERSGHFERAVDLFQRAIALEPSPNDPQEYKAYVDSLNYVAYMWAERGLQLDQALVYIQKALDVRPESAAYIDTLGWIYFMQQRYDEALREVTRALDLLPDDPTITEHMGDVQDKLGRQDEALDWWKKSFVLDPANAKLASKLTDRGVDLAPLREEAQKRQLETEAAEPEEAGFPAIDLNQGPDTNVPGDAEPGIPLSPTDGF